MVGKKKKLQVVKLPCRRWSHSETSLCTKTVEAPPESSQTKEKKQKTKVPVLKAITRHTPTSRQDQSMQLAGQPGGFPTQKVSPSKRFSRGQRELANQRSQANQTRAESPAIKDKANKATHPNKDQRNKKSP